MGKRAIKGEGVRGKKVPMKVQAQLLYRVLCIYGLEVRVPEGHRG
jgi:hypothetical protein